MARISPASADIQLVLFSNVQELDVAHNLGRFPFVEVFQKVTTGMFGFGDFEVGDFGVLELHRPLDRVHREIVHLDDDNFRVVFDNGYEGEVQYF